MSKEEREPESASLRGSPNCTQPSSADLPKTHIAPFPTFPEAVAEDLRLYELLVQHACMARCYAHKGDKAKTAMHLGWVEEYCEKIIQPQEKSGNAGICDRAN